MFTQADNSQAFADVMTANLLNSRKHNIQTVINYTGCTEAVAEASINEHGCKWLAITAIRKTQ
jgi:hypothetical protein